MQECCMEEKNVEKDQEEVERTGLEPVTPTLSK